MSRRYYDLIIATPAATINE